MTKSSSPHRDRARGLVATLAVFALSVGAAAPDPRTDAAAVVDRYLTAYAGGDAAALAALYAPGAVFVDVAQRHRLEGRPAMAAQLVQLLAIHKAIGVEEVRRATDGPLVVVEVVYTGTLDCAALGRPDHPDLAYRLPAVLLFEVADGHIQSQTDYLDHRTFTETFGALLPPA